MKQLKIFSQFILLGIVLGLLINPASSAQFQGFGGFSSDDNFQKGDEIMFGGSVYNFYPDEIYIQSLNVSFVEKLGTGADRDPEIFNTSKHYDQDYRELATNATFTDILRDNIDFETGPYWVSVFFVYSNSSIEVPTNTANLYTLINQTVVISGTTQALEIARWIGIFLAAATGGVVLLLIINRFRN